MGHEIEVDKQKYEIPKRSPHRLSLKYPFNEMEHGDSFDVQCSKVEYEKVLKRIQNSFYYWKKSQDKQNLDYLASFASSPKLGFVCRFWIVEKDAK